MTGELLLLDGGQHLAWRTPDALLEEGSLGLAAGKGKIAP